MAYVYRHIRLDTMKPFYIGVGSDSYGKYVRSKVKNENRNKHWHSIVDKCGYRIDILMDDLTWEQSLEKEIEFIKLYGRVNSQTGILCNLTDGGEGNVGYIAPNETIAKMKAAARMPSRIKASVLNWKILHNKVKNETEEEKQERCKKIGNALLGGKRTKEQKDNISKAMKGKPKSDAHKKSMSKRLKEDFASGKRKPYILSEEQRENSRIRMTNRVMSKETREKLSVIGKKKIFTKETRDKISKANKGKKHTEESKLRMCIIQSKIRALMQYPSVFVYKHPSLEFVGQFKNAKTAGLFLKMSETSVYKVLKGKREYISGHIFKREAIL